MKRPIALALVLALTLVTLGTQRLALAAAPSNDNFANATLIPTAGFVDRINTSEATIEATEPNYCYPISNSVWYKFSAGTSSYNVTFDTTGSDYPAYQTLYLATADGLQLIGCFAGSTPLGITASPGETWYVQVTGTPDGGTTGGTSTTTATSTTTTGTTGGTTGETTTTGTTSTGTTTSGTGTSTSTTSTTTGGGTSTGTTGTGTSSGTTTTGTGTTGTPAIASTTASTTASGNLVFTVTTVQIVPIDMSLTIDSRVSVNAAGDMAVVTGTVTCSRAVSAQVSLNVTQIHARRLVATGSGNSEPIDCGPSARRWTATIFDGGPVRFGAGAATADASAYSYDDHGAGAVLVIGANVKLKH